MSQDDNPGYSFSIDLPVRNEWRNVDLLRTSVQNCFAAVFQNMDDSIALSMVTGELLENALKYGCWDGSEEGDGVFRLRVFGGAQCTQVSVSNPVEPSSPALETLTRTLDWIRGFESPGEAYRARLLEIAGSEGSPSSSGLGLVRVAYEGNCSLEASVKGRTLCVVAKLQRSDDAS